MSELSNPTVSINVTERELAALSSAIGYNDRFPQLQTKLYEAAKDMRQAKRVKNRAAKLARKERQG